MHKNRINPNWGKIFGVFIATLIAVMFSVAAFIAPHLAMAGSIALEAAIIGIWSFIIALFAKWIT